MSTKLYSASDYCDIIGAVSSLARKHCDQTTAEIIVDSVTAWSKTHYLYDGNDVPSEIKELKEEIEDLESTLDDVRAAVG